jgi:nitrous oxidase accessory protein
MFGLLTALALAGQAEMTGVPPAFLEPRPSAAVASPLQQLIDATPTGGVVEIPPGRYTGVLVVDRPMRLRGRGRPVLIGASDGSVIAVRAPDVTIEGVDIDGVERGDLGRDSSGIHVAGRRATIRDCRITRTLFGVYLREADGSTIEGCAVRGIRGKDAGEKGSGIHVWNTNGFRIVGNDIRDTRDGLYIQSSSGGYIARTSAVDLRYGIHYMFSDDNTFEDNLFANGAAGSALMYSRRITFRRNRFLHNRGFASVGLLLKACDDVVAEDNLIGDNARGIFLEGSYRNRFQRNIVAQSDTAIVLYDSAGGNLFEGNSFVANLSPLSLVGRRTDTVFRGNYWSDHHEPDLDGDGRSDRPYRLSSVFDHLRSNLMAADLFTSGVTALAIGAAERTFPVLDAVPVEDRSPLARPPALTDVPAADAAAGRRSPAGIFASLLTLAAGAAAVRHAARRPDAP